MFSLWHCNSSLQLITQIFIIKPLNMRLVLLGEALMTIRLSVSPKQDPGHENQHSGVRLGQVTLPDLIQHNLP